MKAADQLAAHVGGKPACAALEVSRSTFYPRRSPTTGRQRPRPTPARALSEKERDEVYLTLCSDRFVDRAPAEVVATLLDEDVYLCSERTMYRVLDSRAAARERRAQRRHPEYTKPELMATAPNQVWSWDITRLLGPKKWSYYYYAKLCIVETMRSPGLCGVVAGGPRDRGRSWGVVLRIVKGLRGKRGGDREP